MAPIFSKMAVTPSPLGQKPITAEDIDQSHILIRCNLQSCVSCDATQSASLTQRLAPFPPPHGLQASFRRQVVDPYLVKDRDRARAHANTVASEDIDQIMGSLPLNAGDPLLQQASMQGDRKRKAQEVERGQLVPRFSKKTKSEPACITVTIEPIPQPSTPAPADAPLHFSVAMHSNMPDTLPSGGVISGDLPGITAHEQGAVEVTEARHGSIRNLRDAELQIIAIQKSLDQCLELALVSSQGGRPSESALEACSDPSYDVPSDVESWDESDEEI